MEKTHPEGSRTSWPARWSFRAPLLLAAAVICLINAHNFARQIPAQAPRSPWEGTEVMEAWRSLRGLPVYDLSPDGHATHFYGALAPWLQGEVFRWVGTNNVAGRLLTLVSALATVTVVAVVMRTTGAAWHLIVVCAALLGINHRTLQYFSENRPDMTAMFFTTSALVLLGLGVEQRRRLPVALGTACLIVGFFFKQTAGAFAVVPPIVLALRGRWPSRSEVLLALAPLAAMIGVVQVLRAFPAVYHYMIDVPRSYRVDWPLATKCARDLLLDSPLFLVLFSEWLATDGGSLRKDARMPWLLAVLAVGIPSGAAAQAKFGGAPNSMLPALLGMMAFCALRLPGVLSRLEQGAASLRACAAIGSFAASLLLLTVFPHYTLLLHPPPWNDGYGEAITTAARLPGTVVCPEDPTVALYAKSYAGRGLFAELDAHARNGAWPKDLPEGVVAELRAADFVVDIRDYWGDHLKERDLRRLGFVPADGARPGASLYRIWRREAAVPASDASRTAWNAADESSRRRSPER